MGSIDIARCGLFWEHAKLSIVQDTWWVSYYLALLLRLIIMSTFTHSHEMYSPISKSITNTMRRSSSPDSAESEDKLLSDEESNWPQQSQQRRSFGWRTIALLAATAGISCFAGMAIGQHSRQKPEQDLNEACTPHVSNHCKSQLKWSLLSGV